MKNGLLLLLLFAFLSCRNESTDVSAYTDVVLCDVRNPAANMRWLRERIEADQIDIVRATTYNNQTYIDLYRYIWSCTECHLYRCDGSRVDLSTLSNADRQELHRHLWSSTPLILYKRDE